MSKDVDNEIEPLQRKRSIADIQYFFFNIHTL